MGLGAENRGGLFLVVKRAWVQIPPFAHFLLTNFESIILEIIRRSLERNFMSSVLFATVLHEESMQEENLIKAGNLQGFFVHQT